MDRHPSRAFDEILNWLTVERSRLMAQSMDESQSPHCLQRQVEAILREFVSLAEPHLAGRDSTSRAASPSVAAHAVCSRLFHASKALLEANEHSRRLPLHPEPAQGFPDGTWLDMVSEANHALLGYQQLLAESLKDIHRLASLNNGNDDKP